MSSLQGEGPAGPGRGSGTSSHSAPSQANQYHFPVLELGNYEGERLPDLSPALHYFADIKINCLILGKHMLQFKLSALVCSGIICIDRSFGNKCVVLKVTCIMLKSQSTYKCMFQYFRTHGAETDFRGYLPPSPMLYSLESQNS